MPLKGLRANRSERDLQRRSTFDPFSLPKRPDDADLRAHSSVDLPTLSRENADAEPLQHNNAPRASWAGSPPPSPDIQPETPKTRRFSIMRFRHASDSQLSAKAKEHAAAAAAAAAADSAPPVPAIPTAPQIITTAPTMERSVLQPPKKPGRLHNFARRRLSFDPDAADKLAARKSIDQLRISTDRKRGLFGRSRPNVAGSSTDLAAHDSAGRLSVDPFVAAPGELGYERPSLNLPVARVSDSSTTRSDGKSEGSSGDHVTFATPRKPGAHLQQASAASHFFKFSKRNKNRNSLFPLPVKIPPPPADPDTAPATPRASTSQVSSGSPTRSLNGSPPPTAIHRSTFRTNENGSSNALATPSLGNPLFRNDSSASARSARSSPGRPHRLGLRGRSSTMTSVSGRSDDAPPPTPPFMSGVASSGRNSTSTTGRTSFSNLFGLGNRFRQNSEPHSPRHGGAGTPGLLSHQNSMNISREALVLPEREEGEAPGKYLERLLEVVDRNDIAALMTKSDDEFHRGVLRSYMRKFLFFGEPLDMSVRKLLLEVDLPKETQQIDRVLQGFADRYHECNPGIYKDAEQAYFISFSILILHTDFFNKNNKRKMQKRDYLKNASSDGVSEDVLACFYDNICYTPFIHFDEGIDLKESVGKRNKKNRLKVPMAAVNDPAKKAIKEPIDPYTLILDNKLDILRPPIKDVMNLIDPYSYHGTAQDLDVRDLHDAFYRYGIIQIESSRSRPEAFAGLMDDPTGMDDGKAGVVEMPVTKVGIVWRKDLRKRTARSPWQEWGLVLTRSGLSFFKNSTWVKGLMHQYENHTKRSDGTPCVFSPAITDFKSDHYISMDGAVALLDTSYKNHKNAFAIFAKGGVEEIFRAENEGEMNDWLAKINFSAAFATSGIRPRGLVGGRYEGQRTRGIRRLETSQSTKTVQTATGAVQITSGRIDPQLAATEATYRRELMQQKILDAEQELAGSVRVLDGNERDARHLLIVAPVQPKTREQVVHAAGRMAAKLKWTRIEMWRMKCHRDILLMDLEEERRKMNEREARYQQITNGQSSNASPSKTHNSILARLSSKGSTAADSQKSPSSPVTSMRPGTKSSLETELEETFKTPSETSRQNSPAHAPEAWQIPTLSFRPQTPQSGRRASLLSSGSLSPRPHSQGGRPESVSTLDSTKPQENLDAGPEEISRYATPIGDDERRNTVFMSPERPTTAGSEDHEQEQTPQSGQLGSPGSPESRSRIRRSLHRTLRNSQGDVIPGHRRSGKGKDSTSTIMSDEGPTESEILARGKGSFTVHGKKASVITFGAEWQNMSAEERLKVRKQAQEEDSKSASSAIVEEEGRATLDKWLNGRDRALSTTSQSTTTAPSLRHESSGSFIVRPRATSRERRVADGPTSLLNTRKVRPESMRTMSQDDRSSVHQSISETNEDDMHEPRDTTPNRIELQSPQSQAVGA